MALPIFLRPLLLIGHYYRLLTGNITGWLEHSNDQLFGPLEQMIVAVVITGLAMNPGLLPQIRPQPPNPFPIQPVPVYHQQPPAPPLSPPQLPQSVEVNITAPTGNDTSLGSAAGDTGHSLLNFLPSWRPNPIIMSLIILLISVLIHFIPSHLLHRVKHSWDIFWPPWQDRSHPRQTSRSGAESTSRSIPGDVSRPKEAKSTAEGPDGSKAAARAGPSADSTTDEEKEKAKRKAILAYEAKKAAARGPDDRKTESKAGASASDTMTDEEKAKRKAILMYQAKKAAAAKEDQKGQTRSRGADGPSASGSDSKSGTDVTRSVKAVVVDSKKPDDGKTQSEKAREAKDPAITPPGSDDEDKKGSSTSGDGDDPLMAGDVRPLRSILKKSKKKPRQSKNVHHNHFMTMRGNRAHLIPFPHGLHPPPDRARNTLWWKNIPKNADHIMAPPPVPKVVTDVLAGEDPAEIAKKAVTVETVAKAALRGG